MPGALEYGTLYISMHYGTAVHLCCCGCGEEVVTPFSPTDWTLRFDGERVTLDPSIGNWSFPCQSHYWIRDNRIVWAAHWTPERVAQGRRADREAKQRHYAPDSPQSGSQSRERRGFWTKIMACIRAFW